MSTRLSALSTELVTVKRTETGVAAERDASLARIERLEADVATLIADLERAQAEAAGSRADRDAAMTDLATVSAERDGLSATVTSLQSDVVASDAQLGELSENVERLNATNAELRTGSEQLTSDNTELAGRLVVAEQARIDLEAQLEEVSGKWQASARQLTDYSGMNDRLDAAVGERNALREHVARTVDGVAQLRATVGTQHDQLSSELAELEQAVADGPSASAEVVEQDFAVEIGNETDFSADVDALEDVDEGVAQESEETALGHDGPTADDTGTDDVIDYESLADTVADLETNIDPAALSEASTPFDVDPMSEVATPLDTAADGDVVRDARDSSEDAELADDDVSVEDRLNGSSSGGAFPAAISGAAQLGEIFGAGDDAIEADPFQDVDATAADQSDAMGVESDAGDGSEPSDVPADEASAPAGEPPIGGRRRIETPDDLTDEESIARHVITVPDVVLLIDGDGVAGLGWPHLDVAARRDALGRYLSALTADSGAAADVVFQRAMGGEESLPVSRAVRVRIADQSVTTSSIIRTIVDGYPEEWPIAIVTDESAVAAQADGLNITHLTNGQLLDLFLHLNADQ